MKRCLGCRKILWPWSMNFKLINPLFDKLCSSCVTTYQHKEIMMEVSIINYAIDEIRRLAKERGMIR